jgi:hypothetical protein
MPASPLLEAAMNNDKTIIEKITDVVKSVVDTTSTAAMKAMEPEPLKPGEEVVAVPAPEVVSADLMAPMAPMPPMVAIVKKKRRTSSKKPAAKKAAKKAPAKAAKKSKQAKNSAKKATKKTAKKSTKKVVKKTKAKTPSRVGKKKKKAKRG